MIYPNPVSGPGPVVVEVNLTSAQADVTVVIFTTAFRKVNEIDLGALPPGVTDFNLDLRDHWGRDLANGLYYVVVRTSQGKLTAKLLVNR